MAYQILSELNVENMLMTLLDEELVKIQVHFPLRKYLIKIPWT
jgi:hypothetical protein